VIGAGRKCLPYRRTGVISPKQTRGSRARTSASSDDARPVVTILVPRAVGKGQRSSNERLFLFFREELLQLKEGLESIASGILKLLISTVAKAGVGILKSIVFRFHADSHDAVGVQIRCLAKIAASQDSFLAVFDCFAKVRWGGHPASCRDLFALKRAFCQRLFFATAECDGEGRDRKSLNDEFDLDLEGETCGCELNEPQAVMAGVGIVIVGLDVTDAAIIILELTLNEKIGLIGERQIQIVVAGVLVIERDLEVFAAGLSDGHMFGTDFHWPRPCFRDLLRPYVSRLPEGLPQGNNLAHIA
jgi:hypothetical protein